ncbi:PadR family transcriptional regulator [Ekhidna sp. MALMAid0563]|uniref:PadR family transcriptional regulator n=1 Tax=Ekhidna sp. MALMAid0563 TaxID=3143937 RepID=UPI0032DF08E1
MKITNQELMVLSILDTEKMYGYQIVKELGGNMLLGSLYNLMKQLERKDLVKSEWGEETGEGARRKYYSINGNGRKILAQAKDFYLSKWGLNTALG